jgi:hypothetical protein
MNISMLSSPTLGHRLLYSAVELTQYLIDTERMRQAGEPIFGCSGRDADRQDHFIFRYNLAGTLHTLRRVMELVTLARFNDQLLPCSKPGIELSGVASFDLNWRAENTAHVLMVDGQQYRAIRFLREFRCFNDYEYYRKIHWRDNTDFMVAEVRKDIYGVDGPLICLPAFGDMWVYMVRYNGPVSAKEDIDRIVAEVMGAEKNLLTRSVELTIPQIRMHAEDRDYDYLAGLSVYGHTIRKVLTGNRLQLNPFDSFRVEGVRKSKSSDVNKLSDTSGPVHISMNGPIVFWVTLGFDDLHKTLLQGYLSFDSWVPPI